MTENIRQLVVDQFLSYGLQHYHSQVPITTQTTFSERFRELIKTDSTSIRVVIGIKSFALHAEERQAIRETWLRLALTQRSRDSGGVHYLPFFIIGDAVSNSTNSIEVTAAISRYLSVEHSLHGDLLLHEEVPVRDSYFTLPQKSLHFVDWAVQQVKAAQQTERIDDLSVPFVILCDDDVYVDVPELSRYMRHKAQSRGFYAGEVIPINLTGNSSLILSLVVRFSRHA
jgi:hypothetical protein